MTTASRMKDSPAQYDKRADIPEEQNQLNIPDLLAILRRRVYYILVFVLLGFLAGLSFFLLRPKYEADGSLRIEPGRESAYESASTPFSGGDEKVQAEAAVLQTRTLLYQVARDLDLVNQADFDPYVRKGGGHLSLDNPELREAVLQSMRKRITVSREIRSEVVTVTCTTHSATLSANVVNALMSRYIDRIFQLRYGTANRVSEWMISQLEGLRQQVQADQENLVQLQRKLGIVGLDARSSVLLQSGSLQTLTQASTQATINRILAEARLRYLQQMNPNLIENETPLLPSQQPQTSSLLESLRAQQSEAEANYRSLLEKYDVNYPLSKQAKAKLDALNRQIKDQQDRIIKQANAAYQAASANEAMTKSTLDAQENQSFDTHDDMVKYTILEREYESHRDLYEGLLRHLKQSSIDAGMQSADVDLLDLAEPPQTPSGFKHILWMLICLGAGLFIGIAAAILADFVDTRLADPALAEKFLHETLVGTLPVVKSGDYSVMKDPHSPYAESMQLLRSNLLLSTVGHAPRSILITSAAPGEGKSMTSRNLALTLASHGRSVLLVDADLRRPTQHSALRLANRVGLSTMLSSDVPLSDCIQKVTGEISIDFLAAGPVPPNPAVLLGSERMKTIFARLLDAYEIVVLDTAPIATVSDTMLFAKEVDVIVLVVRQNRANRRWVKEARDLLVRSGGNLIGFVMNAVDYKGNSYYGYGAGYGSYRPREDEKTNG